MVQELPQVHEAREGNAFRVRPAEKVKTDKCKRVRPTIGQKLPVWARRWKWPQQSYCKDEAGRSSSGGGSEGWVATARALEDVYDYVKD